MVNYFFRKSGWPFLTIIFIFSGRASKPDIQVPASASTSIQEYKTIRNHGYHKKRDTDVFLAKGDTYTIMATGQEQHPVKKGAVEGRLVIGVLQ